MERDRARVRLAFVVRLVSAVGGPTESMPIGYRVGGYVHAPEPVSRAVRVHTAVNRALTTVALLLGIVVLAAVVYLGVRGLLLAGQVSDALSGETSTSDPAYAPTEGEGWNYDGSLPDECWDPGGGEVCAPGGLDGMLGGE